MSDYLIIMDTGEKFLAHHGVLGQKWGKWNAETAARYAGGSSNKKSVRDLKKGRKSLGDAKSRTEAKVNEVLKNDSDRLSDKEIKRSFKQLDKDYKTNKATFSNDYYKTNPITKRVTEDPRTKKALNDYMDSLSEESRFGNLSKDEQRSWVIKAADKFAKDQNDPYWTKERARIFYLYDDGDQGSHSSFNLYLDDRIAKGKVPKDYISRQFKAFDNYEKTMYDVIDDVVGNSYSKEDKRKIWWVSRGLETEEENKRKAYYRYD